jgi:hypothetical protein
MKKNNNTLLHEEHLFNKLGDNRTKKPVVSGNKKFRVVLGKGTNITGEKKRRTLVKRKVITQKVMSQLIKIAKKHDLTEQGKSYRNSFNCLSNAFIVNDRLYGNYCKNRGCLICSNIRKAEIINKYFTTVNCWKHPYFVTLSTKAINKNILNVLVNKVMQRRLGKIMNKHRKRNQRGDGIRLVGIKSFECSFNALTETYHPHYHLIVPNRKIAKILIKEWVSIMPKKLVNIKGQEKQKINKYDGGLVKCMLYLVKIFPEPDIMKMINEGDSQHYYVAALHNILSVMSRHRIFNRFGFQLPKVGRKRKKYTIIEFNKKYLFDSKSHDWINTNTKKPLASFKIKKELEEIFRRKIDTITQ